MALRAASVLCPVQRLLGRLEIKQGNDIRQGIDVDQADIQSFPGVVDGKVAGSDCLAYSAFSGSHGDGLGHHAPQQRLVRVCRTGAPGATPASTALCPTDPSAMRLFHSLPVTFSSAHIITRAGRDDNAPAARRHDAPARHPSDSSRRNSLDPEHGIAYRIEKI